MARALPPYRILKFYFIKPPDLAIEFSQPDRIHNGNYSAIDLCLTLR